jgi:hypothetical protein
MSRAVEDIDNRQLNTTGCSPLQVMHKIILRPDQRTVWGNINYYFGVARKEELKVSVYKYEDCPKFNGDLF